MDPAVEALKAKIASRIRTIRQMLAISCVNRFGDCNPSFERNLFNDPMELGDLFTSIQALDAFPPAARVARVSEIKTAIMEGDQGWLADRMLALELALLSKRFGLNGAPIFAAAMGGAGGFAGGGVLAPAASVDEPSAVGTAVISDGATLAGGGTALRVGRKQSGQRRCRSKTKR